MKPLMEDGSPRKGFDDETCCEAGGHMLTFAGECRNIHFLQIVFRGSWTGPSSGRKFFSRFLARRMHVQSFGRSEDIGVIFAGMLDKSETDIEP